MKTPAGLMGGIRAKFYGRIAELQRLLAPEVMEEITSYVNLLEQEFEAIKEMEKKRWESGIIGLVYKQQEKMTDELTDLKPCPFCGMEAWVNCRKPDGQYYIECYNCGAAGPICRTEKDRDWEWNRRGPRVCIDDDLDNQQGLRLLRAAYDSIEAYIIRLESYCKALELDNKVLREAYEELREELED